MIPTPTFPDDFRVLYADGGASYWWWSPDEPKGFDGTWPVGTEPPAGIMITGPDSHEIANGDEVVVSWEFGPETESGPWGVLEHVEGQPYLQNMVAEIVRQRNQEKEAACAATNS